MPEIICQCDNCKQEAVVAYCDGCLDEIKEDERKLGHAEGRLEAEEEIRETDKE